MNRKSLSSHSRVRKLAMLAIFVALAYVIALVIRFPVGFLTLDLKDAVIAIGAMAIGPFAAFIITAGAALLEFLTVGDTGVYGLIMDVLSSVGFAFTAALIYKYKKTFSGAILALCGGVATMTAVMIVANLVITPYYMGVDVAAVRAMIPTVLLPFNFLKAVLNAGVVALLYKPLTKALSRLLGKPKKEKSAEKDKRSLYMTIVSVFVIALALCVLFIVMDAGVSFGK